jgi:tetratricopeptide (TPR) repeat protein
VAFFPLKLQTEMNRDGTFRNDISMGGAELSDYNGFICIPDYQDEAITALSEYVEQLNWTNLYFKNVRASEKRIRLFMKPFERTKFVTKKVDRVSAETEGVNNSIYPYAILPDDFDAYLNSLSANTRQKARRFLRKIGDNAEFRITHADKNTYQRDLNTLFRFWEVKWAAVKGKKLRSIVSTYRVMLDSCFEAGELFMPVLWKGETPLGVLGTLIDRPKNSLYFLITGRDESFNSPPPGFMLHAYSIRWAIENGFTTYDFLQGNEAYKYLFATEERYIKAINVSTKNKKNLGEKLDIRSLPFVLEKVKDLHKSGKLAEAERAYRQMIGADPRHPQALYFLAQIMQTKANHAEAKTLYKSYLALKPEDHGAWFRLGQTLQAQGDTDGAIQSYRKVQQLDPRNRDVAPLLSELSALPDRLRQATGTVPAWLRNATHDMDDELLRKLKSS